MSDGVVFCRKVFYGGSGLGRLVRGFQTDSVVSFWESGGIGQGRGAVRRKNDVVSIMRKLADRIVFGGGMIPVMRKVVIGAIFGMALGVLGMPFADLLLSNVSSPIPGVVSMASGTIIGVATALKVIV